MRLSCIRGVGGGALGEKRLAMGGSVGGDSGSVVIRLWCVAITVLSLALSASGAVINPGCTTDLSNKVKKFSTEKLVCKDYGFPLFHPYVVWALKNNKTQVTTMVVAAPLGPNKWTGLGFSFNGMMKGATALVATLGASGVPNVKVYDLNDNSQMGVVEDTTGNRLVFVGGPPETFYDQGRTVYLSFQVDFAKSSAQDHFLLLAYGPTYPRDGSIDYHDNRDVVSAQFATGEVTGEPAASKRDKQSKIHGSFQILGWGLLLPVGALVARYARGFDPAWFYTHIAFQILGFACVIAGVVTGLDIAKNFHHKQLSAHKWLGLFLFFLAILQVLAVGLRPNKDAKVRKYWNWYHAGVGRLALFLAVINIFIGLTMGRAEADFKIAYIVILAIEFLAFIILEVNSWLRWSKQQQQQQSPQPSNTAFQYGGSV